MSAARLAERDLRLVLDAAGCCSDALSQGVCLPDVLDALAALVPCELAFWSWWHFGTVAEEKALTCAPTRRPVVRAPVGPWVEHLSEHPIMSGLHGPVTIVSDVLRGSDLERTWLYQEVYEPAGIRAEIGLEIGHSRDDISAVVLSRGRGRDFSERDRLVLRLVRPHVDVAIRHLVRAVPQLTPRERQVLELVREGRTNAQVARRLAISESTVAKHLEHIYVRTGAHSRLEAVSLFL